MAPPLGPEALSPVMAQSLSVSVPSLEIAWLAFLILRSDKLNSAVGRWNRDGGQAAVGVAAVLDAKTRDAGSGDIGFELEHRSDGRGAIHHHRARSWTHDGDRNLQVDGRGEGYWRCRRARHRERDHRARWRTGHDIGERARAGAVAVRDRERVRGRPGGGDHHR